MSWSERQTELQRERRQAKRKESRALLSDQFCARRGCSNMLFGAQRRTRKYCSVDCRVKAYRRRHPEIAQRSRKPYQPPAPPRDIYWGLTAEAKARLERMIADRPELLRPTA